ncbi:hypothetical protein HBI70_032260 [Parastagonospora nodorum]|nr:hypothetical protein HBI75_172530 [Parastagonospora nodorum]KAH5094681.1 hypothetical protein HBH72_161170 [Parastagonospora nodorum]KAH5244548.1 hypothetical protein HBI72_186840 [Parastagonospora nodorum]KAH5286814.1 hypothetical protein HBI70_032260 [Parastagonospora nodorum]KAH5406665.1 hypothetical protein HBI46_192250 [Parastagonospora nodorum]
MFTRSRKQGPHSEMDWEFLPYNQNIAHFISICDDMAGLTYKCEPRVLRVYDNVNCAQTLQHDEQIKTPFQCYACDEAVWVSMQPKVLLRWPKLAKHDSVCSTCVAKIMSC